EARGKDKRGNGTASANVQATLTAEGDRTAVEVITDLSITGKPAQFGRGVIQDVSDKLLAAFVNCISGQFAGVPPTDGPVATDRSTDEEITVDGGVPSVRNGGDEDPDSRELTAMRNGSSESRTAGTPAQASPDISTDASSAGADRGAMPPSSSSADAGGLDLLSTIGPVLLKRYGPFVLAGIGLLVIIVRLAKRSRSISHREG
ncbi:MAG: hypothetical protein H0T91_12330, partial [Propionibacteriaceae bacterium]|nr:hypothetical protein [Propionibacteriaceae bacterium]